MILLKCGAGYIFGYPARFKSQQFEDLAGVQPEFYLDSKIKGSGWSDFWGYKRM